MFPTQGDVLPSKHLHQADPVELAAMIGCKGHYRIVRTPWTGSWALLTYGNRQVYVPASCRQSLLQAAHAAMHDGMGSTGYLLKKAFYWPTLAEDARQFTQACRAIHTTKAQRREQGPPPPPRDRNPEPEVEQKPRPARPRARTRGRHSGTPRGRLRAPWWQRWTQTPGATRTSTSEAINRLKRTRRGWRGTNRQQEGPWAGLDQDPVQSRLPFWSSTPTRPICGRG